MAVETGAWVQAWIRGIDKVSIVVIKNVEKFNGTLTLKGHFGTKGWV